MDQVTKDIDQLKCNAYFDIIRNKYYYCVDKFGGNQQLRCFEKLNPFEKKYLRECNHVKSEK